MVKVAIMGHGTVGSGVYEVFEMNAEKIARTVGEPVEVKYVLDLRDFSSLPYGHKFVTDFSVIENDPEVTVVAEVMGGVGAAYQFTKRCLEAGKSVCTSNKELVATKGDELLKIAEEHGVNYMFEASVGGGIPVLHPLSQCLGANEIYEVRGILNGTTNYMLSAMTNSGADYAPALRKAQELGYAEADPTADVEGLDARRKIVLSADLAFGVNIREEDIPCVGISSITAGDIAKAKDEGLTYAQDRGRQYGVVGFLVLFLVIMIYNMVRGLDNSLPLTLFWAYLSCEAAGRYFARKEKSVLATAVLAGLASLFSLVSYILETLP